MTVYILNTPVLTAYGEYRFSGPLTTAEAVHHLQGDFTSAVGHGAAAAFLSRLLDLEIPKQRITIAMQAGDSALVLRLRTRLAEGRTLSETEMAQVDFELGWLQRLD